MLHLTCTIISSEDLARYGLSRAKDFGYLGIVEHRLFEPVFLFYIESSPREKKREELNRIDMKTSMVAQQKEINIPYPASAAS